MSKLIRFQQILICSLTTIMLSGCLTDNVSDPITDTLAKTPLMYKSDVQQGNVIHQSQVNKLEPGMSKRQVQYLMGTPMLKDTFHRNRWDYVFTMKRGGHKMTKERITLFFNDDQLHRIEGTYKPDPNARADNPEIVVSVPDHKPNKGIIKSAIDSVGFSDQDESQKKDKAKQEKTDNEDQQEDTQTSLESSSTEKPEESQQSSNNLPQPESAQDNSPVE